EENHYYSYGLKIAGISSRSEGSLLNKYGYQGDFSEHDAETALDEFDLRHFDSQMGRWTTPDPYEEFANPYLGMGNNPVRNVDPDGGSLLDYFKNAAGQIIWTNETSKTINLLGQEWKNIGKSYFGDVLEGFLPHWLEGGRMEMLNANIFSGTTSK